MRDLETLVHHEDMTRKGGASEGVLPSLVLQETYLLHGARELEYLYSAFLNQSFPSGSAGKEPACNVGDPGSIPGLGRSPGEGNGYPLQYSGLENSMECVVYGVAKSRTGLSDFHFTS